MSTTNHQNKENIPLLEHANECAKKMACRWIQGVFRQVFVQTLSQLWSLRNKQVHITHDHIQASLKMCTKLATLWCRRLRDAGQAQMAEWVHQVLNQEQFLHDDNETTTVTTTTTLENESNDANPEIHEMEPLELPEHATNKLILSKIRQLGQRNILEQGAVPSLERVSQTLDVLGRNHETNWPLEWSMIETAALQNHKRLHLETLNGKPRPNKKKKKTTYEVVPKSLVSLDETNETHAILAAKEPLAKVVQRKRKMVREEQQMLTITQEASSITPLPTPTTSFARPPSTSGQEQRISFQKDVLESLSIQEREKLERTMIHTPMDEHENDDESNEQTCLHSSSIVGALQPVGDIHYQLHHDESMEDFTENKRRRLQGRAKRQRVFPRVAMQPEKETRRAATRVVRSVANKDAAGQREEQWMELDMTSCLMDVMDSETNQTKLCAFSSLQVMLQDEDAESGDP